ncbi:hypothetical protein HPB50_006439 [Hyalomma asiaticum]|uniref:Uncharacterized protein n=1 Tax=Hyalomma asiaticum TaxID=266040 RepID=A0ACB7S756_HYAAI|nr:hypothetical protein HPB50_006439 [Hyalomma asiaticum]
MPGAYRSSPASPSLPPAPCSTLSAAYCGSCSLLFRVIYAAAWLQPPALQTPPASLAFVAAGHSLSVAGRSTQALARGPSVVAPAPVPDCRLFRPAIPVSAQHGNLGGCCTQIVATPRTFRAAYFSCPMNFKQAGSTNSTTRARGCCRIHASGVCAARLQSLECCAAAGTLRPAAEFVGHLDYTASETFLRPETTDEREPWRVVDASQRYLACVFGTCGPACAFCTRVQPGSGIGVSLRSVEYSPFLVGVEWRRVLTFSSLAATLRRHRSARSYRIGVTTCWTWKEESCTLRCGPEEPVTLSGPAGSFSVPADLYSGSVQLRVRGLGRDRPGAAVFRAYFQRKQLEPSSPCDVTVRTLGWSVVRLSWKSRQHAQLDGFQVRWCRADSTLPHGCSELQLPRNVSSVVLMGLVPFIRYKYTLRSFKGDPNGSDVLFSMSATATRRDRLSFELFLYTEMLVVFFLAGALTLVALLTIGFILMRALGLTTFLDVEPNDLVAGPGGARECQAQGDHRRHVPGVAARRRRGAAAAPLPRVRSRGDS